MLTLGFGTFFAVFIIAGLLLLFGLWAYYDRRDRLVMERQRGRRAFHCVSCDHLYGAPAVNDSARCPRCGFENGCLKF